MDEEENFLSGGSGAYNPSKVRYTALNSNLGGEYTDK